MTNPFGELNEVSETRMALPRLNEDKIYRPFFIAGIATVLSLGCVWGAINLLAIGLNQNFSTISYSWILAHGHAMVFGFVGFFIMGFAYQVFPRFKQTNLWRPRFACSSLPLMVAGIALQTVAHLIVPSKSALPLELLAATLQLAETVNVQPYDILVKLFPEELLRVFRLYPVEYHCPYDEENVKRVLRGLGREELEAILSEQGEVRIRNEMCNHEYRFDRSTVEAMFR